MILATVYIIGCLDTLPRIAIIFHWKNDSRENVQKRM